MATPKIKVYKLDRGYVQTNDNDVQQASNDELLPIVDKSSLPDDAYLLVGVTLGEEDLTSVGAHVQEALSDSGMEVQSGSVGNWINVGAYAVVVKDSLNAVIASTEYTLDLVAGTVTFLNLPYPTDATIDYWTEGGASALCWASTYYPWYSGPNDHFWERISDVVTGDYAATDYTLDSAMGSITFDGVQTVPTAKYYYVTTTANLFVSDYPNWVIDHMRTNPDIFKGTYDYPGDDSQDGQGNPIVQSAIPMFVETGYQIDYRSGSVNFSTAVDSTANPVRANFAYYYNIKNVTSQILDLVDDVNGWSYQAVTEKSFPTSHSKKWVTRNNNVMPINFYVNGTVTPALHSYTPYDVPVMREATTLASSGTAVIPLTSFQVILLFTGTTGQTATVDINNVLFTVGNVGGSFVWDIGGTGEYTFTTLGEEITRTASDYEFTVAWVGTGSFYVVIENIHQVDTGYSSS